MPNLARPFFFLLLFSPLIGCSPASSEIAEKVSGEKIHFTDVEQAQEPIVSLVHSLVNPSDPSYKSDSRFEFAAVDLNNDGVVEVLLKEHYSNENCSLLSGFEFCTELRIFTLINGALIPAGEYAVKEDVIIASTSTLGYRDLLVDGGYAIETAYHPQLLKWDTTWHESGAYDSIEWQ